METGEDTLILAEPDRAKLDGIIEKMTANKESDADIQFVVEDFKNKYGQKKSSDQTDLQPIGEPSVNGTEITPPSISPSPSASPDSITRARQSIERRRQLLEQGASDIVVKEPIYQNEVAVKNLSQKVAQYAETNLKNIYEGAKEGLAAAPPSQVFGNIMESWVNQAREGKKNILGSMGLFTEESAKATVESAKKTALKLKQPQNPLAKFRDITIGTAKTAMDAAITAGSVTPAGMAFVSGIEGLKEAGVPEQALNTAMSLASSTGQKMGILDENSSDWEKQLFSIGDLMIMGAGMHMTGKTFGMLKDGVSVPEMPKEAQTEIKDAFEKVTENDIKAAATHPESPELAKKEKEILDTNDDLQKVSDEAKPIVGEKLNALEVEKQQLEQQEVQTQISKAHEETVNEVKSNLQQESERPDISEPTKEALKQSVEQIKVTKPPQTSFVPKNEQAIFLAIRKKIPLDLQSLSDEQLNKFKRNIDATFFKMPDTHPEADVYYSALQLLDAEIKQRELPTIEEPTAEVSQSVIPQEPTAQESRVVEEPINRQPIPETAEVKTEQIETPEIEPTKEELLNEDLKAYKFPPSITISEREAISKVTKKGQVREAGIKKGATAEQIKSLQESLAEAVKNPSSKNYDRFYDDFIKAYESPFKGSDAVKKLWAETMRAFPEIESWRKEDVIAQRFTTPKVAASGFSLGIPLDVMPKRVWQKHVKKEGDLPIGVFKEWIKTKGSIDSQIKQVEFTIVDFKRALRKAYGSTLLRTPKIKVEELEKINSVLERLGTENRDEILKELPESLRDVVSEMRDQIDALSRALARSGLVDDKLQTKIEENLGFYMTRSYRIHSDKGWNWNTIPDEIKIKAARVLSEEFPNKSLDEIEGILKSYVNNRDIAWDFVRSGTLGSKDLGITKERKDIPIEIREFLGQFKDPAYNYATSIAKLSNLVEKHKFLERVKEDGMDKWLFEEKTGDFNVKIAAEGSKTLEPLNGLYTTKEIAEAFKKYFDPNKAPDWLRLYMKFNSVVKYSKTILSPKTHARNFVSNFLFHIANGRINFTAGKETTQTAWNYLKDYNNEQFREYYKELIERGVVDEALNANELKSDLQDAVDYIHDFEKYGDNFLRKLSKRSLKFLGNAYMIEDNVHKIYAFEVEKSRYTDVVKKENPEFTPEQVEEKAAQEAATIVRLTMPTYSEVPLFIKNLRRFPLTGTFVTFPYEVLRNSYNTVWLARKELRNPNTRWIGAQRLAGVATAATVTASLSLMTRSMLGLGSDDEEDIRRFLPSWSKNSDLFYISNSGDGKFTFLDMGYSDPYNYIKKPFNAIAKGDRNQDLIDASIEFVKPFLGEELLAGRIIDLTRNTKDTGARIWNPEAPAGERFKDMVNYLLGAFEPGGITDSKRIYKAYKKSVDDFSASAENEILAVATGQRVQTLDVGKAYTFKARKTGERIYNAVQIYNTNLYSKDATEEDKEKYYKIASESLERVMSDARKDYSAALNLGVPKKDLDRIVDKIYLEKFPANSWVRRAIKLGTDVIIDKKSGKLKKP